MLILQITAVPPFRAMSLTVLKTMRTVRRFTVCKNRLSSAQNSGGLQTVAIPSENIKFGTYTLNVNFSNSEQNISANAKIPFSVCQSVTANGKNTKMGVGAHFNWGGRNIHGSMNLLDKTGFSHIREGYAWTAFETVTDGERNYGAVDVCTDYIEQSSAKNMEKLSLWQVTETLTS
ncbi:MAG: hypothetical protein L6V93_08175 [Clostridiales bacterium]|nr:MAG: hypothetical protein L6V93_08175 [Clostridiales bacterium]